MKRAWFVRRYRDGDEHGIARLMKMEYGLDEDFWRELWIWECKKNPNGHLTVVAEHDGQIVGHMSLVVVRMKVGHKSVLGSQAVDLIVHPNFRGQGMFLSIGKTLLGEAERRGIAISYGYTNEPARRGHLKYGWFDVCYIPTVVKFLNTYKTLRHVSNEYKPIKILSKHKIPKFAIESFLRMLSVLIDLALTIFSRSEHNIILGDVSVMRIQQFDNRVNDLWNKVAKNYRIIVIRDSDHLNWRYFIKPNSKYTVFVAEKNNEISGYIVLRLTQRAGYITDILTCPDRSIVQSLLSKAIEHFRLQKVDWVLCNMLAEMPVYQKLRDMGFIRIPSKIPLIARVNSTEISEALIKDAENWRIISGDTVNRRT